MRILVSNDDGINSPGIYALAKSLRETGDVTVVAPFKEQSAVGHGITMQIPLRVHKISRNGEFFGYAVEGTPADCVKMGIKNILKTPPDIVVSGINNGSNTAVNIIYSGTVSAAREAAIMDVPSIAISVTNHATENFSFAAKFAKALVKEVVKNGLPAGTLLNVNVPDVPEDEIAGVLLTKQGKSKWDDVYEQRVDPYGREYYWLTGSLMKVDTDIETDQAAIEKNYISVTPVHFDLTDYKTYESMKQWDIGKILNGK